MAIWVLRCPECGEKFRSKSKELPCPHCGWKPEEEPEDGIIDIPMPFIRISGKTAAADKLYRDMEKGSEVRAQAAAEQLGVPVSEMSALKMTDMRDNAKPGENSVVPVRNDVTQFMAANPGLGGFQGANGVGYSGAVQTGPAPNAGAHMRTALQNHHAKVSMGSAVSDLPALETTQPGYRRRG